MRNVNPITNAYHGVRHTNFIQDQTFGCGVTIEWRIVEDCGPKKRLLITGTGIQISSTFVLGDYRVEDGGRLRTVCPNNNCFSLDLVSISQGAELDPNCKSIVVA